MRYKDTVTLIKHGKERYNAETGDYDTPQAQEIIRSCHVSDMGTDTMQALFGSYVEGAKVFRFRGTEPLPIDELLYRGHLYLPKRIRHTAHDTTIEVRSKQ